MVSHGSDASRDGNTSPSVTLARLLTELAALPPEQRAAIAALLSPTAPPATLPTQTPVVVMAGDDKSDRLHRGYEGGSR